MLDLIDELVMLFLPTKTKKEKLDIILAILGAIVMVIIDIAIAPLFGFEILPYWVAIFSPTGLLVIGSSIISVFIVYKLTDDLLYRAICVLPTSLVVKLSILTIWSFIWTFL